MIVRNDALREEVAHFAELGVAVLDQLFAGEPGQVEEALAEGLPQVFGRGFGVFLRAALGFRNDGVDETELIQVLRRSGEGRRRHVRPCPNRDR